MDMQNTTKQEEDSAKEEGELSDDADEEPKENVPFVNFSRSQQWTGLHTSGRSFRGRRKSNSNAHPHLFLVPEIYDRPSSRDFNKRVGNYGRPPMIPSLLEISTAPRFPQRQPLPSPQYLRERLPSHYENWQGGNRIHNSPSSRLWERRRLRSFNSGRSVRDSARDTSRTNNDDGSDFEALLETYRHIQEQLASLVQEDASFVEGEKEDEETKEKNSDQREYEKENSSKDHSEIIAIGKGENVPEQSIAEKKMEEVDEEEEELDIQELRRIALASLEEREKAKAEAHAAAVAEEEKKSVQAKEEKIAHVQEEKKKGKTSFASNKISRDDQKTSPAQHRKTTQRRVSGGGHRNSYRDRERRPLQYASRHQAYRPTTNWRKPNELECRQLDERRRQQELNIERKRQESARLKQEFQTREIQKILTLDDPEEQVERFLKLLDRKDSYFGSKNKSPTSQSGEQRFPGGDNVQSAGKQELTVLVTELQDNYEEVEMDIDSEPSSPVMTTEVSVELQLEPDFISAMQPVGYLGMEEMPMAYSSVWMGPPTVHHYPQFYQPQVFPQVYLLPSEPVVLPPLLPEEPPLNPPLPTEPPPLPEQPPPPPSEDFKPPLPLEPPPPPPPPEEPPEEVIVKVEPVETETYARPSHINDSGTRPDQMKLNSSAGIGDIIQQSISQVLAEARKQSSIEQDRKPSLQFIQPIDTTKQQSIPPADTKKLLPPPPPPPIKSLQTDVVIQEESFSVDEFNQQSTQKPAVLLSADKWDKEDDDEADILRKQLLKTIATKRKTEEMKVLQASHVTGRVVSGAELQQDISIIQEGSLSEPPLTTKGDYSPSSSRSQSPLPTVTIPKIIQPKNILRQQQIQQLKNLPVHKPVVINLGDDSSDDDEETVIFPGAYQKSDSLLSDLDLFLKEARQSAQSMLQNVQMGWSVGKKQSGQAERWKMREVMKHKVRQCEEEHLKMGKGITTDQALLRTLVEKATKYLKSLKVSEAKVEKLTEQLAAAEKIALANKEQLEKAKKQARLVKDRLLNKKKEYEVLERTLLHVGREAFGEHYSLKTSPRETTISPKRKFVPEAGTIETGIKRKNLRQVENLRITITNQPQKKPAIIKMSAEEIAREKKRLQQLAVEYEKKIRLLKQTQLEQETKAKENIRPVKSISKPIKEIPRLEVIELDSKTEELEEEKPNPRRRSLLEMNPSTKPNITIDDNRYSRIDSSTSSSGEKDQTVWSMPEGETLNRLCEMQLHRTDQVLNSLSEESLVSLSASQNLSALLPQFKEIPGLHLLKKETPEVQNTDVLQPIEFTYRSPLLHFKAYRFSPYFRTRENLSLSSITFCNKILPKKMLCRFDIQGTCHDENCKGQHQGHYSMSEKEILQDIVSYCPEIAGVTRATPVIKYPKIIADYVDRLLKQHQGRLSINEMCLLLISRIKERNKKYNSDSLLFETRAWKPVRESKMEDTDMMKPLEKEFKEKPKTSYVVVCKEPIRRDELATKKTMDELLHLYKVKDEEFAGSTDVSTVMDTETGEQDVRYYGSGIDFHVLEEAVLENPLDEQLWMKLARRKLNNTKQSPEMCLDHALNVLARGLEANKSSFDLWHQYLTLYSHHSEATDLASMCHTALQYVRHRKIFWLYIHALGTVHKKDEACVDLIHYLKEQSHSTDMESSVKDVMDIPSPSNSHYLLEAVLYRVFLSLTAGRYSQGLQIAQEALEMIDVIENLSSPSPSQTGVLTLEDRTILWLSYCHLKAFRTLPPQLFDPAHPMSGRIVCKDSLIFPWFKISKERNLVEEVLSDLRRAIQACLCDIPEEASLPKQTLPLYQNLIYLLQTQARFEDALNVCRDILMNDPTLVEVWLIVANLYAMSGSNEATRQVFADALEANPFSATVYYHAALYEMKQGENGKALVELEKCAMSFFDIHMNENGDPNNAYCDILEQPLPLNYKPIPYKPEVSARTIKEEKLYLWINFCLLLELQGDSAQALEMYETALNSFTEVDYVTKIWLSYLEYQYRCIDTKSESIADSQKFTSLFHRCLMTVPTKFPVPHHSGEFWQSYSHVNQVINFCLSCLRPDRRTATLEKISTLMPSNIQLVLRACKELLDEDNPHSARIMCNPLVFDNTASIQIWKLVISLATKQKDRKEIRKLFHRAVRAVPFSSELWNDFLLFEVTEGQRSKDIAMEILSQCQDLGVNVDKSILFGIQNRT